MISPAWLTSRLRRGGHVRGGEVIAVRLLEQRKHHAVLSVVYSPGTGGGGPPGARPRPAPARLILKRYPAGYPYGRCEAAFYERLVPQMPDPPVPPCYGAWIDGDTGQAEILLEDLSATHAAPQRPIRLPPAALEALVDTYLRVHTSWWNHAPPSDPRCDGGSDGAGAPLAHAARSPQTIRIYERSFAAEVLPERATRWGRAFPPRWRTLCERAIAAWAGEFSARMAAARALTLIHGDAHLQNVLLPRDPRTDRPVLIDWEGWTCGLGLWDLAGVLIDWQAGGQLPAEARRDLEGTLLSRYHAGLRRAGIGDYSTQDCRDDYRLCLLASIPHALAWRDLPYLSAAIQAFEDWDGDARRA